MAKKTKRRKKGTGSLFRRGGVWWYVLKEGGKRERRTTGCTNRDDANASLRERVKELKREGTKAAFVRPTKITVETLLTTLRDHYTATGKASADTIGGYIKAWGASPLWRQDANELRYDDFDRQAVAWQSPKVSNATINRRLSLLRAAYRFARKKLGLTGLPEFPRLRESSRLTDKFSRAEIEAICFHLAQDYADLFRFACATGVRKGQLLATTLGMVDPENWSITWPREVCKKREPHTIHLDSPALEIVQRRYAARRPDHPLLFHHDGKPIRDMREPLKKAFSAAGIPYGRRVGKVFHGTRRTAVTNLVESGVPRSVAKTISGHSSDEMFERYAIHESDAQRAAQRQVAAYVAKQPKKPKVVPIATKKKKGAA